MGFDVLLFVNINGVLWTVSKILKANKMLLGIRRIGSDDRTHYIVGFNKINIE